MRNIIVAFGGNRVIGSGNDLPWRGDMPADMRHFRTLTLGHVVIMGRRTYESIGHPLKGRDNIVVSRSITRLAGCIVSPNLGDAFQVGERNMSGQCFVIGGESVYTEAMSQVQRLHVTEIDGHFEGDAFFPTIDEAQWTMSDNEDHPADEQNRFDYRFLTYDRRV